MIKQTTSVSDEEIRRGTEGVVAYEKVYERVFM
jgi:hypothetical protein